MSVVLCRIFQSISYAFSENSGRIFSVVFTSPGLVGGGFVCYCASYVELFLLETGFSIFLRSPHPSIGALQILRHPLFQFFSRNTATVPKYIPRTGNIQILWCLLDFFQILDLYI